MNNQRFGQGDIVTTNDGFRCRVIRPILADDGWWYEVEAVNFNAPFTRVVRQDQLREVGVIWVWRSS